MKVSHATLLTMTLVILNSRAKGVLEGQTRIREACPGDIDGNGVTSRHKRSLVFPKGSAFVITLQLLKAIQLKEPKNFNLLSELDFIWPLPNQYHDKLWKKGKRPFAAKKNIISRVHRRELYANLELALESRGLPGRDCILRTICESRIILNPPGLSFVDDLLRIIFRNVETPGKTMDDYDVAFQGNRNCGSTYPCPFSLLDFLLYYDGFQ